MRRGVVVLYLDRNALSWIAKGKPALGERPGRRGLARRRDRRPRADIARRRPGEDSRRVGRERERRRAGEDAARANEPREARAAEEPGADAIRALQRSAGNRATTALLQRRWVVMDKTRYFWEEDGTDRREDDPPSWLAAYNEVPAPTRGDYQVDDGTQGRMPRGKPTYYTVDQWVRMNPQGSGRGASDVFNPFGRMATAPVSSFLPSAALQGQARAATLGALAEKDPTYKPVTAVDSALNDRFYPVRVTVEGGQVLEFVEAGQFGAVYASVVPPTATAGYDPLRAKDPSLLRLNGPQPAVKMGWNWAITPLNLQAWSGKKREISQAQVMGGSAGDAAENAGFSRDEGQGWEWLHMIAHSMGGIEGSGPQVSENLVAGTSECNSQMIVTEEWIKDTVTRSGGQAKLWVGVEMLDPVRHIGRRIVYDFEIYNATGGAVAVFHVEFDPLSRRQPLAVFNRTERYAAREQHPEGAQAVTQHTPRSQPTAHVPNVAMDEDPVTKRIEAALAILKTQGVDAFHAHLESVRAGGTGIPRDLFMEVGEILGRDQVLPYLQALRRTTFGERAVVLVVYAYLLDHAGSHAWMLDSVLVPLYAPAPVPDNVRAQCAPRPQPAVAVMDVS